MVAYICSVITVGKQNPPSQRVLMRNACRVVSGESHATHPAAGVQAEKTKAVTMSDLIMVALILVCFAMAQGYARLCVDLLTPAADDDDAQ